MPNVESLVGLGRRAYCARKTWWTPGGQLNAANVVDEVPQQAGRPTSMDCLSGGHVEVLYV